MSLPRTVLLTEPAPDLREVRTACADLLGDLATSERVRACESGRDAALWKEVAEAGWTALGLDEDLGGAGFGPVAHATMLEEAGRALAPAPLLAGALAMPFLVAIDSPLLPDVISGEKVATLVLDRSLGAFGTAELDAAADGEVVRLDGRALCVLEGHLADLVVVVAAGREPGSALVSVLERGTAGMTIEPVATVDVTRQLGDLLFEGCTAPAAPLAGAALDGALAEASASLAADLIGTASQAMDLTLYYLKTRHQFGVPIGSFQALKHRCADLASDVTLARELVHAAAGSRDRATSAAALMRSAAALVKVRAESVQLHGGIGFTEEHDIGLYHRRALVDASLMPAPVVQQTELAGLLALR